MMFLLVGILFGLLVQEHAILMGATALQKDQTPAVAQEAVSVCALWCDTLLLVGFGWFSCFNKSCIRSPGWCC